MQLANELPAPYFLWFSFQTEPGKPGRGLAQWGPLPLGGVQTGGGRTEAELAGVDSCTEGLARLMGGTHTQFLFLSYEPAPWASAGALSDPALWFDFRLYLHQGLDAPLSWGLWVCTP